MQSVIRLLIDIKYVVNWGRYLSSEPWLVDVHRYFLVQINDDPVTHLSSLKNTSPPQKKVEK